MSVSLKIKIFDAEGTKLLQIAKANVTIGSAAHCDIVVSEKSVHPEHARAWLEGGRLWVQDLGGSFGTSLNDIRLPALKPMLVRELDVLRLGECQATLNLEAIQVRQPVVKPAAVTTKSAAAPAVPAPEAAAESLEAGKRRAELEKLGRELAEVRLQLQVAKLDRDSDQERNNQVESLREEVKNVREQQGKWTESLRQMENEKQVLRKKAETEITEFKIKLQADLKIMREQDQARLEAQKKQIVTDVMLDIRSLSNQKVRTWATRPLSAEMVGEWEGDLNLLLRKTILNETPAPAPVKEIAKAAATPTAAAPAAKAKAHDGEADTAKIRVRRAVQSPKAKARMRIAGRFSIFGLVLFAILVGVGQFLKPHGATALASQGPKPSSVAAPLEPKSNRFRATYTENVLYLTNYLNNERDPAFRGRWFGEVMKAAQNEWKLEQSVVAPLLSKEQALLQDLAKLGTALTPENQVEVLAQMRSREAMFDKDLASALKGPLGIDRFMKFKKIFYQRNQKI